MRRVLLLGYFRDVKLSKRDGTGDEESCFGGLAPLELGLLEM